MHSNLCHSFGLCCVPRARRIRLEHTDVPISVMSTKCILVVLTRCAITICTGLKRSCVVRTRKVRAHLHSSRSLITVDSSAPKHSILVQRHTCESSNCEFGSADRISHRAAFAALKTLRVWDIAVSSLAASRNGRCVSSLCTAH